MAIHVCLMLAAISKSSSNFLVLCFTFDIREVIHSESYWRRHEDEYEETQKFSALEILRGLLLLLHVWGSHNSKNPDVAAKLFPIIALKLPPAQVCVSPWQAIHDYLPWSSRMRNPFPDAWQHELVIRCYKPGCDALVTQRSS